MNERPWRRDAHWWALKYGAIAAGLMFVYMWRRANPPDLSAGERLVMQVEWALGFGLLCGVIVFCVRFSGALVDVDELDAAGRGGLGLNKRRRAEEDATRKDPK